MAARLPEQAQRLLVEHPHARAAEDLEGGVVDALALILF
jgi:hypothetical protein